MAEIGIPLRSWDFDLVVNDVIDCEVLDVKSARRRLYITRMLTTQSKPDTLADRSVTVRIYSQDEPSWIDVVYHLGDRVDLELDLKSNFPDTPVTVTEVYKIKEVLYMAASQ